MRGAVLGGVLGLVLVSGTALAGGLEFPDNGCVAVGRGGAFLVKADDLTAFYHNPAALTKSKTRFGILYSHNFTHPRLEYERVAWDYGAKDWYDFKANGVPNPVKEGLGWFKLGAMGVIASDLFTDRWMFAFGVYGPSAVGTSGLPINGSQKYMQVDRDILLTFYTLSVAYQVNKDLSFGVSLQWVDLPKLKYTMVIDGYFERTYNPFSSPYDILATLDVKDRVNFTALVGAWWRPHPNWELGLSSRVIPVWLKARGKLSLTMLGLQVQPPDGCGTDAGPAGCHPYDLLRDGKTGADGVTLRFVLPPYLRLGGRYVHRQGDREVFDVEVDFVWEFWRMLKSFDVALDADHVTNYIKGGPTTAPINDISMRRDFKDAFSVRVGGDWNAVPGWLKLRAGAYYESPSAQHDYTSIDFVPFHRFGIGTGFTFTWKGLAVSGAYSHIFQPDWGVTDERTSRVLQQRPAGQCASDGKCDPNYVDAAGRQLDAPPVNTGIYRSSFDIVSISLAYTL